MEGKDGISIRKEDSHVTITFVRVSTYLVFAYGGPGGNDGADAAISLGIPDAYAFLSFYPEDTPLPPNSKGTHISGKPIFNVSYRAAHLGTIVDLLRWEKPIRFFFRDDNLAAYLTTAEEPVGEEES
jgi:hypothetical protein